MKQRPGQTGDQRSAADEEMLRTATRRMAWQLAAASAIVVVLATVVTLLLGPLFGHDRGERAYGADRDDEVLRSTLVIAGVIGVVLAGVVGLLIARRAVAPLGEALARQRRFVADAGHELRTPLTVLFTRAQLIQRRMAADDPAQPAMRQLLEDSRGLSEIVDELLASAQLAGDPTAGEPLEVGQLLDEVAGSMSVLAEGRGVRLSVDRPTGELVVAGSRVALRRALTALVDNALGHTPAGGTVVLAASALDGRVVLSVTDSGEGIAGLDAADLTRRFARGPGAADGPGGRRFGLGLALVREVAVSHGGELSLRPASGGGARAEIALPARTQSPAAGAPRVR